MTCATLSSSFCTLYMSLNPLWYIYISSMCFTNCITYKQHDLVLVALKYNNNSNEYICLLCRIQHRPSIEICVPLTFQLMFSVFALCLRFGNDLVWVFFILPNRVLTHTRSEYITCNTFDVISIEGYTTTKFTRDERRVMSAIPPSSCSNSRDHIRMWMSMRMHLIRYHIFITLSSLYVNAKMVALPSRYLTVCRLSNNSVYNWWSITMTWWDFRCPLVHTHIVCVVSFCYSY